MNFHLQKEKYEKRVRGRLWRTWRNLKVDAYPLKGRKFCPKRLLWPLYRVTIPQKELDCFSHEDKTEVYHSCSLIWNNRMYIYGGADNKRKISKLNQYMLQIVGSLPFEFYFGACTNMADRKLYLCFSFSQDETTKKQCYWSANPLDDFESVSLASYVHGQTKISSSTCKFFFSQA